ncbi:pentapeptide repeat-containing protein [filamentous cyanobacterium LEGE 11480]|uniref:Pentapeptide repeat-containing protein n=1 Tax=Romeriopsis navalis LEGE 11480 TaxID=2777977 RepID=A0A928VNJ0_9CYAN|nr:pentapeptide repeat-containing protein [Romeriopsis navalis]MBE9031590.1 pentapeptide repeat-containing protein [Romeriopsis navalis LEGE 11480]
MADKQNYTRQKIGKSLCLLVFGLTMIGVIWEAPRQQVDPFRDRMTAKEAIDAEIAARTGWIQLVGGGFVALTAITTWRTSQANQKKHDFDVAQAEKNFKLLLEKQEKDTAQAEKNFQAIQEKNTADRFSKAVEMLGHDKLDIRLGGIFALEQIANTEDKYYWQIMEILTAYIRTRSPWPPQEASRKMTANVPKLDEDIQAAMTVIVRRKYTYQNGEKHRLNLCNTDLRYLYVPGAKLQGVSISDSSLEGAFLCDANLEDSLLTQTILTKANLSNASLQNSWLACSELSKACFNEANLEKAHCINSHFTNAFLTHANLEDINLISAQMTGVKCLNSNLKRAILTSSNWENANLENSNLDSSLLRDTNLTNVNFQNTSLRNVIFSQVCNDITIEAVGLTQKQLNSAKSYEGANLPSYISKS